MSATDRTTAPANDGGLAMGTIFNLSRAVVMVVDDNAFSLNLTTQMLRGFGISTRFFCSNAKEAVDILKTQPVDLLIVDCEMPGPDGYDLVTWLRQANLDPNSFTPVLMMSGHTRASQVTKARDCGANFIITRPITPTTLLERVLWMARDPRAFVQSDNYTGPDRRFNEPILPKGQEERRADRLRAKAAEAALSPTEQDAS